MAASIFRFTNGGEALGMLKYEEAVHEEDLDGTDKLVVTSQATPAKRDRLLWQDNSGTWHEHMVDTTVKKHAEKRPRTESTCSNSISELYGVIASGTKFKGSVQGIMNKLLEGTRWTAGVCSNFKTVEIEVWHKSVRECIAELCELTDGELETIITVDNFKVTGRTARIVKARGSNRAVRQFMYGRNVTGINREVAADEVFTAIVGFGAKIAETELQAQLDALNETDTSGFSQEELDAHNESKSDLQDSIRRVRENDYAKRYTVVVESGADLSKYGIPKGSGYAHNYATYTDNACTDTDFLKEQCKSVLKSVSKPLVRYEFDVSQTDDGLWSDVRLGNRVLCHDDGFPELNDPDSGLLMRVSYIKRRLAGRMQCRIAIGKRSNYMVKQFKAAEKTAKKVTGNGSDTSPYAPVVNGGNYSGEGGSPSEPEPEPVFEDNAMIIYFSDRPLTTDKGITEEYTSTSWEMTQISRRPTSITGVSVMTDWHRNVHIHDGEVIKFGINPGQSEYGYGCKRAGNDQYYRVAYTLQQGSASGAYPAGTVRTFFSNSGASFPYFPAKGKEEYYLNAANEYEFYHADTLVATYSPGGGLVTTGNIPDFPPMYGIVTSGSVSQSTGGGGF